MNSSLRFRQIHLDFHTSEHIPGIGAEFDPDQFVATLKEAAVDSITCFSRCHHGFIYHPTKFPYAHPNLTQNLLGEQIRACHAADIKVPIYITVGWDHLMAMLHPEWTELDADGNRVGRKPLSNGGGWINMDFASPYVDYVIDQTQEVCDMFGDEVDGIFFDIIFQRGVHSSHCLDRFKTLGWDPADLAKQVEMRALLTNEVTDRLYGAVREKNQSCAVFFNGGHVGPGFRPRLKNNTHLEIESLPTDGWGYMHFPITSRYARTLDKDYLAMTGKFSETWGHFNSYKNPAALEYECLQALAQAGKCSVGDQLHPGGRLDKSTYDLVGPVYRKVRELEPWCVDAKAVTEIGVLNAEEFDTTAERMDPRNLGAARMLIEGRHQFDFIDTQSDWSAYKLLILADVVKLNAEQSQKLSSFVENGGSVIASGDSIFGIDGEVLPAMRTVVAATEGPLEFSPDFVRLTDTEAEFVMYERGNKIIPAEGSEVVATISEPYFNRTWDHFCSHAHSPVARRTNTPAVVSKGNITVFAHPIFTTYGRHSMKFHRDLVLEVISRHLPSPVLSCPGATSLQANLTRQGERHLVHLLHYIPERRGLNFDIVEDALPVLETVIRINVQAKSAYLVPGKQACTLTQTEGGVEVVLPGFTGYQMVCLEP